MNEQQREQAIRTIAYAANWSLAHLEEVDLTALRVGLDLPPDASMEQVEDRICGISAQWIAEIRAQAE